MATETSYATLCACFDRIQGISGRLQIIDVLTDYLGGVVVEAPDDLTASLFLACNTVAPPHANVQLGIGDALLVKAICLLYTSPSPRDQRGSRMPSSA